MADRTNMIAQQSEQFIIADLSDVGCQCRAARNSDRTGNRFRPKARRFF
jgi:hypothetical protein